MGAEIWAGGVRLYIHGYAERDRAYDHEPLSCWLPLAKLRCLCTTLATGQDAVFREAAGEHVYGSVFSFDSHTRAIDPDRTDLELWFYPMNERRLVLRVAAGPLVVALSMQLEWSRNQLPQIAPEAVPSNMPLVIECQTLLDAAAQRMRVDDIGRSSGQ
ncbi:hypothetical protein [Nannocystis punicea]|uniref:Immunity protein 50 n=1 Tax=Nannocystis punicea TaxID=2995304 RepID=A0ABY7GV23_9BACT|nr:hypothetical protein [Nannocystis poenicansa]WAS90821.1 hypothetical protein O0S08_31925 [Nannocystis poenicansa]